MEEPGGSQERPILRPVVAVSLSSVLDDEQTPKMLALVDSGANRVLAGPGLGRLAGVDPGSARTETIGIGGNHRSVYFGTVQIRLFAHASSIDEPAVAEWEQEIGFLKEWEPPWGVVLGQQGFFDRFTVSMNRYAQALAVEPVERFDERFGYLYPTEE